MKHKKTEDAERQTYKGGNILWREVVSESTYTLLKDLAVHYQLVFPEK